MQSIITDGAILVTLQDLYTLLTKSTSHFDDLKERIEELQEGLIMKSLSKTCWIGRPESIRAVWISYEILLDNLDAVRTSGVDRDAILTASHLSERMRSFEFYFAVLFMKNILYKMTIFVLEVREIDQDIYQALMPYATRKTPYCACEMMKLVWMAF